MEEGVFRKQSAGARIPGGFKARSSELERRGGKARSHSNAPNTGPGRSQGTKPGKTGL